MVLGIDPSEVPNALLQHLLHLGDGHLANEQRGQVPLLIRVGLSVCKGHAESNISFSESKPKTTQWALHLGPFRSVSIQFRAFPAFPAFHLSCFASRPTSHHSETSHHSTTIQSTIPPLNPSTPLPPQDPRRQGMLGHRHCKRIRWVGPGAAAAKRCFKYDGL